MDAAAVVFALVALAAGAALAGGLDVVLADERPASDGDVQDQSVEIAGQHQIAAAAEDEARPDHFWRPGKRRQSVRRHDAHVACGAGGQAQRIEAAQIRIELDGDG